MTQALNEFRLWAPGESILQWSQEDNSVLLAYLTQIQFTADYKNRITRPILLDRLFDILAAGVDDVEFRQTLIVELGHATQSCEDRVIYALNSLETIIAIKEARAHCRLGDFGPLMRVGCSIMALQIVHANAAAICRLNPDIDAVEIYLAFEVALRERLNLPGKTRSKMYGSWAEPEDFERAYQAALAARRDGSLIWLFFQRWTPYQQADRESLADRLPYQSIPVRVKPNDWSAKEPLKCAISLEEEQGLKEAVYVGATENCRVYEFEHLIRYWIERGREPATTLTLDLKSLWRFGVEE